MRVLILGGAGAEARDMARLFIQSDDVSRIIVADRRGEQAGKVAAELGKKALAETIDIDNFEGMVRLMGECDLVENCVGPFYWHGAKVLKAAIKAKKDYVDICDDPDAMLEMFELDAEAKEAGITAMVGMGSGPGLSDMICKYWGEKLEQVEKINTYWCVHLGVSGGGVGAGLHGWHMFIGMVPQFLDGKLTRVPAGSGAEMVEFADGNAECYYLGHPETVMLPRYFKEVKEVTNKGTMLPTWATKDLLKLVEMGFGSDQAQKIKRDTFIVPIEVGLTMHSLYTERKLKEEEGKPWSGHKWVVTGKKDGKTVTYSVTRKKGSIYEGGRMELLTAIPATAGALMLARGEIKKIKGVVAPEECLDASSFIAKVTEECGEPFAVTESAVGIGEFKG